MSENASIYVSFWRKIEKIAKTENNFLLFLWNEYNTKFNGAQILIVLF